MNEPNGTIPEPEDPSIGDPRHETVTPAEYAFGDDRPPFHGLSSSTSRRALERDAMAWPPATWERAPTAWRDDLGQILDLPPDVPGRPTPSLPAGALHDAEMEQLRGLDDRDAERTAADRARKVRSVARDVAETVLLTAVIFFAIRALVQNFKIEGSSMMPTLKSGQYVLVNKMAYRGFGEPQRGDIVVFESWNDPEKDYIKRIIGLPGDSVEIKDRSVRINKDVLEEPYLEGASTSPAYGPRVLGPDEFFVLGDNRSNSSDSRQHDAMARDQLIGKAWLIYWPFPDIQLVPGVEDAAAQIQAVGSAAH